MHIRYTTKHRYYPPSWQKMHQARFRQFQECTWMQPNYLEEIRKMSVSACSNYSIRRRRTHREKIGIQESPWQKWCSAPSKLDGARVPVGKRKLAPGNKDTRVLVLGSTMANRHHDSNQSRYSYSPDMEWWDWGYERMIVRGAECYSCRSSHLPASLEWTQSEWYLPSFEL